MTARLAVRRHYIDWARGLAVLVMIESHVFDSWVRLAERSTRAYANLMILGGFAAPLFLWLAGLAAVMAADRATARTGNPRDAFESMCKRGLEIFILAFLFRVQAFIVSPGKPLVDLFRVDVLNIMGPSLAILAVVWLLVPGKRTLCLVLAAAATAIAMITPVVRTSSWVDAVPVWVQWYLRPAGEHTTFTVFPWSGFVFAGGAVGALIGRARDVKAERRLNMGLCAIGVVVIVLGFYTASLPSIYKQSFFWTSSPTFFAIRVGALMLLLSLLYGLEAFLLRPAGSAATAFGRLVAPVIAPLGRLGRSSLFVYWIHVELVYGWPAWFLRRHLTIWQTAIAYVLFCLLIYSAIILRDRTVDAWRARGRGAPEVAPA